MKQIGIIGAGISGLTLAYYLQRNCKVTLIEKSDRTGGWIQTDFQDGFLFEKGPRSCRPSGNGIETLALIEELGMQEQVITGNKAAKKRYIYHNQHLDKLSPFSLKTFKALWRDLWVEKNHLSDESIFDFSMRHFGPDITSQIIDPMTKGIYAGDIQQLSMRSCFPLLWQLAKERGSVFIGALKHKKRIPNSYFGKRMQRYPLFSLKNGMESLTNELTKHYEDELLLSTEVRKMTYHSDHVELQLSNHKTLQFDHVYSTLPVDEIPSTSIAIVNLGYHTSLLPVEGFGYLVPSSENEDVLGVVWDSSAFPEQNLQPDQTRLTVMIGGAHDHDFDSMSEGDCLLMSLKAISKHLGIDAKPDSYSVKIARNAIPQYPVGHHKLVERVVQSQPSNFTQLGTSLHGVAVNDCIAKARSCVI